jgi:hypothetical protein
VGQPANSCLAGEANFEQVRRERAGSFVGASATDGVERYYAFTRIGDLPLILVVGTAVDDVVADWRARAIVITFAVLVLCGLTVSLALLLGRALHRQIMAEDAMRRANAELSKLAVTDALIRSPAD